MQNTRFAHASLLTDNSNLWYMFSKTQTDLYKEALVEINISMHSVYEYNILVTWDAFCDDNLQQTN